MALSGNSGASGHGSHGQIEVRSSPGKIGVARKTGHRLGRTGRRSARQNLVQDYTNIMLEIIPSSRVMGNRNGAGGSIVGDGREKVESVLVIDRNRRGPRLAVVG